MGTHWFLLLLLLLSGDRTFNLPGEYPTPSHLPLVAPFLTGQGGEELARNAGDASPEVAV